MIGLGMFRKGVLRSTFTTGYIHFIALLSVGFSTFLPLGKHVEMKAGMMLESNEAVHEACDARVN